jgi:hypothetical protein
MHSSGVPAQAAGHRGAPEGGEAAPAGGGPGHGFGPQSHDGICACGCSRSAHSLQALKGGAYVAAKCYRHSKLARFPPKERCLRYREVTRYAP